MRRWDELRIAFGVAMMAFGAMSHVQMLSPALLAEDDIRLTLRYRQPIAEGSKRFHRYSLEEDWKPSETAVIVCDMWDRHHCLNAVRRVTELAPRIDAFCNAMRQRGATIIHAPSSCVEAYAGHPARIRTKSVPKASEFPADIASWCDQIPREEQADYPIDQSDGGEDDEAWEHEAWAERLTSEGRDPRAPWRSQVATIEIDEQRDWISDSGEEIWSILSAEGINHVILCGVHTNMCVLGRPFGLRRLAAAEMQVVLARDLTDTMYNPGAWPYASHFTGTDLIVQHIEKYVCPTISSSQILGGDGFRFQNDTRKRLLIVVAEDEYETAETLPAFAAKHLSQNYSVEFAWGNSTERHDIVGLDDIDEFDCVLVSVRRRAIPIDALDKLREFVQQGKPVVGIRTASHAFSLRGESGPVGTSTWETWDADVLGGAYSGHYGNDLPVSIRIEANQAETVPLPLEFSDLTVGGSLYKTSPLAPGARPLFFGSVQGAEPEPMAWTFVRSDGGRSFYTSLGHKREFAQPEFEAFLAAGICWANGIEPKSLEEIKLQNQRYDAGEGRQR
jgi:type 1 glutamine amidotransferase/nicotinamidase-related amidase